MHTHNRQRLSVLTPARKHRKAISDTKSQRRTILDLNLQTDNPAIALAWLQKRSQLA